MKPIQTALFIAGFCFLTFNSEAQPPSFLTNGLVAYYPFNGNANDASTNGNNGALFGTAAFGVDRYGTSNSCLSLPGTEGTNSGVDISSLSNMSYEPVTYTAWFKLKNYAPYPQNNNVVMTLLGREQCGVQSEGAICIYSGAGTESNQLIYFYGSGGYITQLVPPTNQWCQVVLTIDQTGTANFYFNGTNVPASGSAPAGQPLDFRIGASDSGGCTFGPRYVWNGLIDDVRIYNRVMSASQVQQLFAFESVPVTITAQPQSVLTNAHGTASFTVTAVGASPMTYQWSFDSTNIAGATSTKLTITNVVQTNLGTYAVVVSNAAGAIASSNAVLSMYPFLVTPFGGLDTYWGYTNILSVTAWGSAPLDYQWFQNGVALLGATNQMLDLTGIQFTNAGLYSVVVTDPFGSVTNPPELVVVNPAGVSLGFSPTVTITGVVGYSYIIQGSTNLADTNGWLSLTNLTLTQPVQIWVDTNVDASSPFNPKHFYQVLPGQ